VNVNKHQSSQSQSAIYTLKQINISSLFSAKEMCKNHIHPVQQIKHKTQHRIHVYLIHIMNIANSFYNDHYNVQCFYWYYKIMSSDDNIKTYQHEQAKINCTMNAD